MTDYQDHPPHTPDDSDTLLEMLPVGVVIFDCDLKIVSANAHARNIIQLQQYIDKSLAGTASAGSSPVDWTGLLKESLAGGKTQRFENVRYTGNAETKLLRITCGPIPQPDPQDSLRAAMIIEDRTENANIRKRLADAEKLAAVGKLASKVAHELNNPMDGILRYLSLTMRIVETENLAKCKEYLERCRQGLMRMVRIVSDLLEFARTSYGAFEYVKIEEIIDDAARMMSAKAQASGVCIERKYTAAIGEIRSGSLFQVFCNLISNAIEAMPDSGTLTISTSLIDDETACVEFRDTGTGFTPKDSEAIFQPFFSSKATGKGTGLGLAICKDIIERYPGRITAQANPQGGSIFKVFLPLTARDFSTS